MPGIANFRDFGGLPSIFGGTVRRDRLYRAAAPAQASAEQLKHLLGLDFAMVADLRYAGERTAEPSPWPPEYARRILFHDANASHEAPHMAPLRAGALDIAGSERIYAEIYRSLPYDPYYGPLFARILLKLADTDGRLLIHCSAGKDRTGMAVALIHHALGVPHDAILADFLRSSREPGLMAMAQPIVDDLRKRYGAIVSLEVVEHLLDVKRSYLEAFFAEIERRDGDVDAYLCGHGIDAAILQRLRARLLLTA